MTSHPRSETCRHTLCMTSCKEDYAAVPGDGEIQSKSSFGCDHSLALSGPIPPALSGSGSIPALKFRRRPPNDTVRTMTSQPAPPNRGKRPKSYVKRYFSAQKHFPPFDSNRNTTTLYFLPNGLCKQRKQAMGTAEKFPPKK